MPCRSDRSHSFPLGVGLGVPERLMSIPSDAEMHTEHRLENEVPQSHERALAGTYPGDLSLRGHLPCHG
jgi:hypothetical protein